MADLSLLHPQYVEMCHVWQEQYDFLRGGRHVLTPTKEVRTFVGEWNDGAGASELSNTRRSYRGRFEIVPRETYIWRHAREDDDEFDTRKSHAVHIPLLRHVCEIHVTAAMRTAPRRRNATGEPWRTIHDDVDLRGTDIDAFERSLLLRALGVGQWHAVLDRPYYPDRAQNRQQQLERQERTYAYQVNPLHVINWKLDDYGRYEWVVICEPAPDKRQPGDEYPDNGEAYYRLLTASGWELHKGSADGGGTTAVAGDEWNLSRVPFLTLYARNPYDVRRSVAGDGMLAGLERIDRSILNQMSWMHEVLSNSGFPHLMLPSNDAGKPQAIALGPSRAMTFNAENGQPIMLSPEASLILAHWQLIESMLQSGREYYGTGRGKAEHSKEERSAQALTVESRNERNRIVSLIASLREFDEDFHKLAAEMEGTTSEPATIFDSDVNFDALSSQINSALSLKSLGLPPEAMAELVRPLVVRHMREQGLKSGDIRKAERAITAETIKGLAQQAMQQFQKQSDEKDDDKKEDDKSQS